MPCNNAWQDLHRWADDGGVQLRPRKTTRVEHQRHWLRQRSYLDDLRRDAGRRIESKNRRLEIPR